MKKSIKTIFINTFEVKKQKNMTQVSSDLLPLTFSFIPQEELLVMRRVSKDWLKTIFARFKETKVVHLQNIPKGVSAYSVLTWFPNCEQISYDNASESVARVIGMQRPSIKMVRIGNFNAPVVPKPLRMIRIPVYSLSYGESVQYVQELRKC